MTFSPHRRVVVFGVDGVRVDTLRAARTPRIDEIAAAGFFASFELNDLAPTISGPGWSNIATGVWPDKHLVYCNEFDGHRLAIFRDFLTQLRRWPELRTYAAADWPPLTRVVFANPHRVLTVEAAGHDYDATGADIALDAARALGEGDYHASFVYFGEPDEVCHHLGVVPEYTAAVERADARIGQVVDAIRARPGYADEEWTFIVVTDHGHVDAGGHGGRDPAEARAWIAASGPWVPGSVGSVSHVDVAPSVYRALDFPTYPDWCMAGVPFGERSSA